MDFWRAGDMRRLLAELKTPPSISAINHPTQHFLLSLMSPRSVLKDEIFVSSVVLPSISYLNRAAVRSYIFGIFRAALTTCDDGDAAEKGSSSWHIASCWSITRGFLAISILVYDFPKNSMSKAKMARNLISRRFYCCRWQSINKRLQYMSRRRGAS